MSSPSIILIVLDCLRADRVSSNYKNKNMTPFMNKLLENSIHFENCIANSTWTVPSHINMFTGLYQTQKWLISKSNKKFGNKIPILAEILKDLGYSTISYTENPWINRDLEFNRGFDIFLENWKKPCFKIEESSIFQSSTFFIRKIESILKKKIKSDKLLRLWEIFKLKVENSFIYLFLKIYWKYIIFNYKSNTFKELEKLQSILKSVKNEQPRFLFFNIMATHVPYMPIKKTRKYFGLSTRDFKLMKKFLIYPLNITISINFQSKTLSNKIVNLNKKFYNTCVYFSDLIINKIISILKDSGLSDNFYLIITSDHGEHLCDKSDHYLKGHGVPHSVYESLIKVPLIIYNSNFKKRIVKNQVELKDLFHTILHLTGVTSDKNRYLIKKNSLINQINNNSTPKYIFGEHIKSKENTIAIINNLGRKIKKELIPRLLSNISFLRSNNYKYIKFYNGIEEFYDLSIDPFEQVNLINENNKNYREMKIYLEKLIKNIHNTKDIVILITEKEKELLNKSINRRKITGI
ncbi:MAG: sulfatase-like hydrolase/transferase [Promethearchaeota archaeon]